MTEAIQNYSFEESRLGDKQVDVTNDLGHDVKHLELVLINGYFGEVRSWDPLTVVGDHGIPDGARGVINIDDEREIQTKQIDTGDTFVLDAPVYFHVVNRVLEVTSAAGNVAVGMCTVVNNGVSVGFKPFKQRLAAAGLVVT